MNWKSLGYEPQQAIADLIDNSITAKAKNIWIDIDWKEKDSVISITDDGIGMKEYELRDKMKFGWQSPKNKREQNDLGRFGLGMKVASISKCNSLTVISKTKESKEIYARTWDVDHVVEKGIWELGIPFSIDEKSKKRLLKLSSGTSVIWNNIDSLDWTKLDNAKESFFNEYGKKLQAYIETYYHRFLQKKNFNIYVGNKKCEPWDPFLEKINPEIHRDEIWEDVKVTSYVIPHENSKRDTEQDYEEWKKIRDEGGGIKGWQQQQGIYFYRNDRLIVNGEWLDDEVQESHTSLARIKVDIPSKYDLLWSVDIKKSSIQPKGETYNRLKSLSSQLRSRADQVYRYRGAKSIEKSKNNSPDIPVWKSTLKKNGSLKIRINRQHPSIKDFDKFQKDLSFEQLLFLIETNLDYNALQINLHKNKGNIDEEREEIGKTIKLINSMVGIFLKQGLSKKEAIDRIKQIEPGYRYPEIIGRLESKG